MAQPVFQQPILPRPTCVVWYSGDPCDNLIQQYDRAVERGQLEELQASITAPLQKQIADQQKQISAQQTQIKILEAKIESQSSEALRSEASNQALLDGIGAGLGAGLAFLVAVAAF